MSLRGAVVATVAVTLAATACGGTGSMEMPGPEACVPSSATLAAGASMNGMGGDYTVHLLGEDGRMTTASLTLTSQPTGMRQMEDAMTPLGGTIDVDLEAIGAQPVGALDSADPEAPGVLVLESDGSEGRTILLRLGSEANQRGRMSFDGAFTVLSVQRMSDNGFSGAWWSGVREMRTEGHFCAYAS